MTPISGASFGAIVTGVRGQLKAATLRTAFDGAGLIDENLDQSIRTLDQASRDLSTAGVAAIQVDLIGRFLDAFG